VIISDAPISYPYVRSADILAAMSQGGYGKYIGMLKEEGILIVDQDLVTPQGFGREYVAVPSTRMAEELGRKMMANIIMIGCITAVTGAVTLEAARKTVSGSVPKGTEEMNIKAFNKGYDYGLSVIKSRQKKAAGITGAIS
jgi:2-oxoglutarate ferredoxin oxidoreductase subunit gamma